MMFRRELRYASLLIGLLEFMWSWIAFVPNNSLFRQTIEQWQMAEGWFVAQMLIGLLLSIGACIAWRRGLHLGLALSAFGWGATFVPFAAAGIVTPVSVSMPVLSLFALAILVEDVRSKPRNGK